MKTSIIVNPSSGGGRTESMWKHIRDEVRSRIGSLEEMTTAAAGDATRYARQIAAGDSEMLIIAGGDGTINEVINGLFTELNEPINPDLKIGILSAGRGCDFIKSVGIPDDYREAVDILINPIFKKIDVGCALFKDEFGREQRRFFLNIASAGLGGLVARKVNHTPKLIPAGLAYYTSVAASFLTAKGQNMKVTLDDKIIFDGSCLNVFIANGRYSGSGMCWAPMAKVDDGEFEIVIGEPMPKYQLLTSSHKLYNGTFTNLPGVHHYSGKSVLIESDDDVYLELDGEQPGLVPAAFTILPKVLNLAVGG